MSQSQESFKKLKDRNTLIKFATISNKNNRDMYYEEWKKYMEPNLSKIHEEIDYYIDKNKLDLIDNREAIDYYIYLNSRKNLKYKSYLQE